jgi:hypothetical protein
VNLYLSPGTYSHPAIATLSYMHARRPPVITPPTNQYTIFSTTVTPSDPYSQPTPIAMCKLYLQTRYRCGCASHPNLPGRTCASYRQSLAASHSERGRGDVTSRPCISIVPMMQLRFACPRHRGSQEYWLTLMGWETNVSYMSGPSYSGYLP